MNITEAKAGIKVLLSSEKQRITPIVLGTPGIGKSQIHKQIKKELGFQHLLDVRLSQHDNTDIKGVPKTVINSHGKEVLQWIKPDFLPLVGSKWEGTSGILFLDEINRADPQTLQSIFELVYDFTVGGEPLLPTWKLACAGNLGFEDGTDVFEMDTALKGRFAMFVVDDAVTLKDWIKWAVDSGIHSSIISCISAHPTLLLMRDGDKHVTPRSWEQLSNVLNDNKGEELAIAKIVARTIIHQATPQFLSYLETHKTVSPEDIIKNYKSVKRQLKDYERVAIFSLSEELCFSLKAFKDEKDISDVEMKNVVDFFNDIITDKDQQLAFVSNISQSTIFNKFMRMNPEANAPGSPLNEFYVQTMFNA